MLKLDYAEFYITNVCNLACENCNRFNNFAFTGHQHWNDYADIYAEWAKLINIDTIGILGGEPMLNPDFIQWLTGVADLWPHSRITIVTNGTQFDRWPELYQVVADYKGRVGFDVNYHSTVDRSQGIAEIQRFLPEPVVTTMLEKDPGNKIWQTCYNNIRTVDWPDCNSSNDFYNLPQHIQTECQNIHHFSPEIFQQEVHGVTFIDTNQVKVDFSLSNSFIESALKFDPTSTQMSLYHSDPEKAIKACSYTMCHHFIAGKLYKCGVVGILPEFVKQFSVDITEQQQQLLNSYVPAEANWNSDDLETFVQDLKSAKVIPQCTFCPENFTSMKFERSFKKPKVIKIKNISVSH